MTWTGLTGARFIRPIRWIVAVARRQAAEVFLCGGIAAGVRRADTGSWVRTATPCEDFADYEKKLASEWRDCSPERTGRKKSTANWQHTPSGAVIAFTKTPTCSNL